MSKTFTQPAWVVDLLSSLPEGNATRLHRRLNDRRGRAAAIHEAAAASALMSAEVGVETEPSLNGLTPDLLVPSTAPPLIGEVWSRDVPATTAADIRGWRVMEDRISKIPAPFVLSVVGQIGERLTPPASREARTIERILRRWLLRPSTGPGARRAICGYTFYVVDGLNGIFAQLLNPSGGGGLTSTTTIVEAVEKKVRRYAATATDSRAALMVILGGQSRSGLSLSMVRSVLAGKNAVSITFSPFGNGLIGDFETKLRDNEDAPRFDKALSAVGHIDIVGDTPHLTIFPAKLADQPLPALNGPSIRIEGSF